MTKSVSSLIASGKLVLVVKSTKDRVRFAVYDLELGRILFIQTVPYVRANDWSLSELSGLVACIGHEDGMISTFGVSDGIVKTGFRASKDGGILLHERTIRVLNKTKVQVFDLLGDLLRTFRVPSERTKDIGKYLVSKIGSQYELSDGQGNRLCTFGSSKVGITSTALLLRGLVVAEGGGPITVFDEDGDIKWQKSSPNEFHPIRVAENVNGEIFAIHAHLPTLSRSILTVYNSIGTVLVEHEIDGCQPVAAFSYKHSAWVMGSFHTYAFSDGHFRMGRLEQLRSPFEIEE